MWKGENEYYQTTTLAGSLASDGKLAMAWRPSRPLHADAAPAPVAMRATTLTASLVTRNLPACVRSLPLPRLPHGALPRPASSPTTTHDTANDTNQVTIAAAGVHAWVPIRDLGDHGGGRRGSAISGSLHRGCGRVANLTAGSIALVPNGIATWWEKKKVKRGGRTGLCCLQTCWR
jgi:hypothetical protein